jgi:hypothetical protein
VSNYLHLPANSEHLSATSDNSGKSINTSEHLCSFVTRNHGLAHGTSGTQGCQACQAPAFENMPSTVTVVLELLGSSAKGRKLHDHQGLANLRCRHCTVTVPARVIGRNEGRNDRSSSYPFFSCCTHPANHTRFLYTMTHCQKLNSH